MQDSSLEIDHLEIDRLESQLVYCPLIAQPTDYMADTVDLMRDHDARAYWLTCFKDSLPKFTEHAHTLFLQQLILQLMHSASEDKAP